MDRLFPSSWPPVRALSPYKRGFLEALMIMLGLASILWLFCASLDVRGKAEVLRALAEIGATLLVAYGVVASTIISAAQSEPQDKRKERLGALVGIGGAGLIGIASALVLSERATTTDPTWLEELAFGWTLSSLLMFLVMIALQADVIDSWSKPSSAVKRSRWLIRNRRRPN